MGKLALHRGSEWHLLRIMGRHRNKFNSVVLEAVGGHSLYWLDFLVKPDSNGKDEEWKGLQFLEGIEAYKPLIEKCKLFWPQTGNKPNWDAVGWFYKGDIPQLLLVEAKAHIGELLSDSAASEAGGRSQTEKALAATKKALGVDPKASWLDKYYQQANRIAVVWFLNSNDLPAHLLNIYFCGDNYSGKTCPSEPSGWSKAIAAQEAHLGLPKQHPLVGQIHHAFIDLNHEQLHAPSTATPSC